MVRTVTIEELQQRTSELLDDVQRCGEPILVMVGEETRGVVISVTEYERNARLRNESMERASQAIDRIHDLNAGVDPDEVYRIVTEVVEEVRQERHDAAQSARQSAD